MKGPFEIIEFVDPRSAISFTWKVLADDIFSEVPEETSRYIKAFDKLQKASLGSQGSLAHIAEDRR